MASTPSSVPPFVEPIIDAYAQAIQPAFAFILISAIFSAMMVPLLISLVGFSTPQSRRQPVFALSLFSVVWAICVGAVCTQVTMKEILTPFQAVSRTEQIIFMVLYMWMPWIPQAILVLRLVTIFETNRKSWTRLVALLTFPVTVKLVRAVLVVLVIVEWTVKTPTGALNQFTETSMLSTWPIKTSWILEILDNGYISFLFLWRLKEQGGLFPKRRAGRTSAERANVFRKRLQTLFWIASTNFLFPLAFNLGQIIVIFIGKDLMLAASIEMVNGFVCVISSVFATVWATASSFPNPNPSACNSEAKMLPQDPTQCHCRYGLSALSHNERRTWWNGTHILSDVLDIRRDNRQPDLGDTAYSDLASHGSAGGAWADRLT